MLTNLFLNVANGNSALTKKDVFRFWLDSGSATKSGQKSLAVSACKKLKWQCRIITCAFIVDVSTLASDTRRLLQYILRKMSEQQFLIDPSLSIDAFVKRMVWLGAVISGDRYQM
eukprot:scaffold1753_cov153-Pinguiococcus_pyrenoidosus.AAC.2